MPIACVLILGILIIIVCPLLAPICKSICPCVVITSLASPTVPEFSTNNSNPSGPLNFNKLPSALTVVPAGNPNTFDNCSPGPIYNVAENMGKGPKYSLGAKNYPNNKWKESIPGPGNYDMGGNLPNLRSGPKWGMGTSARGNTQVGKFKNNNPGPGQYNTCRDFNAPCTKFDHEDRMGPGQKAKDGNRKDGAKGSWAGPGAYRIPCSIVCVNPYTREAGKFDPTFRYV